MRVSSVVMVVITTQREQEQYATLIMEVTISHHSYPWCFLTSVSGLVWDDPELDPEMTIVPDLDPNTMPYLQ